MDGGVGMVLPGYVAPAGPGGAGGSWLTGGKSAGAGSATGRPARCAKRAVRFDSRSVGFRRGGARVRMAAEDEKKTGMVETAEKAVKVAPAEKKTKETKRDAVPVPLEFKPKRESFPELVLSRTADTIDDIKLHFVRKYFPDKSIQGSNRPRVIVLGCGWGGHALVKTIDTQKYQVVVVSPRNYFLFTPMLASSAAGTVEFRSICEPIRASNPYIEYIEATCTGIDHMKREIQCVSPTGTEFAIDYAHLVVAVGASTNTFGTPGVARYCHFLKDVDDARRLRRSIIDQFERANTPGISEEERIRLLTFVIVGGGPTGTEFAAELSDFLNDDLKKYYPRLITKVTVKLLNSGQSLLGQFDAALREDAMKNLQRNKIDVVLNARVIEVSETSIKLKSGDELPYGLAVWAAGNGTRSLVRALIDSIPEQSGAKNQVLIDRWLRVKGTTSVFAFGDCAVSDVDPLPATGQVAAQQGSYVARLLNRNVCLACEIPVLLPKKMSNDLTPEQFADMQSELSGKRNKIKFAKPFQFLSLGIMAYVGGKKAVADVDAGDFQVGNVSGRLAFFLWRSVYLTKQVSTRNRILVLQDWIKTRLFGRDISQF
uniref:FAD/NAD(P)-binding domain-containing protein n=1 Tax=Erythrolobus australicus TaxID=1077150 RepID=A0A7S1TJV9_9RHOD|mmetsp:Transcript_2018/g.5366  ORF Transcript_2018/g.5366 Transcript_2018/m.5366 type:complete len:599 (+) Transcript_2018:72-1868(+)